MLTSNSLQARLITALSKAGAGILHNRELESTPICALGFLVFSAGTITKDSWNDLETISNKSLWGRDSGDLRLITTPGNGNV